MTTEQKARAYDEVVNKLRHFIVQGVDPLITRTNVQDFFPELGESEDEKIRKIIRGWIYTRPSSFFDNGISKKEMLAWLEKQGEQKSYDKVEPKFKVGDWIVWYNCIYQVLDNNLTYVVKDTKGLESRYEHSTIDKVARYWTIQDAKDGDVLVLVYGDNPSDHHLRIIMLFKSMRTFNSAFSHFHIFYDEFRINDWCDCGKTAHPATKEQRDLLFSKMKEAGYEWDEDKKELRKIEKQGDVTQLISEAYEKGFSEGKRVERKAEKPQVDDFETELNALLKKYEHLSKKDLQEPLEFYLGVVRDDLDIVREEKPKWSEEDEELCQDTLDAFEALANNLNPSEDWGKLYDWLKSIKQRMEGEQ